MSSIQIHLIDCFIKLVGCYYCYSGRERKSITSQPFLHVVSVVLRPVSLFLDIVVTLERYSPFNAPHVKWHFATDPPPLIWQQRSTYLNESLVNSQYSLHLHILYFTSFTQSKIFRLEIDISKPQYFRGLNNSGAQQGNRRGRRGG